MTIQQSLILDFRKKTIYELEKNIEEFDRKTLSFSNMMDLPAYDIQCPKDMQWLKQKGIECLAIMPAFQQENLDHFNFVCLNIIEALGQLCKNRYSFREARKLIKDIFSHKVILNSLKIPAFESKPIKISEVHDMETFSRVFHPKYGLRIEEIIDLGKSLQKMHINKDDLKEIYTLKSFQFSLSCTIYQKIRWCRIKLNDENRYGKYFSESQIKQSYHDSFLARDVIDKIEKCVAIHLDLKKTFFPDLKEEFFERIWRPIIVDLKDRLPPLATPERLFFSKLFPSFVKQYPDSHKQAYVKIYTRRQKCLEETHQRLEENQKETLSTTTSNAPHFSIQPPPMVSIPHQHRIPYDPYRPLNVGRTYLTH